MSYRTNNALVQTFGANNLNELTNVTRTGTLTVAGTTTATATNVTVADNGNSPVSALLYANRTFARTNVTVLNGNNTFSAIAQGSNNRTDTNSVTVNLPSSVNYIYDLNGNLTSDGTRGFDYDDENQLIRVTVTNSWKSEFTYDGRMRRRIRKEFTWQNSAWAQTAEVHYLYDGMLVIQERDVNNLPTVTYTRGRDLSGSLQGAGGIGGLLARTDAANGQSGCYHADGNGNVTVMINAQQILVAKYIYDPFGNTLSKSGPLADTNAYRFSSQEYHQNSGLVLYLYRAYDPNLQRWLNRDPLEELGGINLYGFVSNDPVNQVDYFGLAGGPYHPPEGVSLSCDACDSCRQLSAKMGVLMRMIASHTEWDRKMPPPRGAGRHADEIADLWRAYAKCQAIHAAKNCQEPKPPKIWERVIVKVPGSAETWNKVAVGSAIVGVVAGGGAIVIACPGCLPILIRLPKPAMAY